MTKIISVFKLSFAENPEMIKLFRKIQGRTGNFQASVRNKIWALAKVYKYILYKYMFKKCVNSFMINDMNVKTNSCNKKILNIDNYASNKPNINKIVI